MTSDQILQALVKYYSIRGYLTVSELRVSTGFVQDQRIDFFAIHPFPSKKFHRVGVEIKVSRSDLSRELANPAKRLAGLTLSDDFFFAMPADLWREAWDENFYIPEECGTILIEDNGKLSVSPARKQRGIGSISTPNAGFWTSFIRKYSEERVEAAVREVRQ